MMWWNNGAGGGAGMGWGGWLLMSLMVLGFWALLVVAVVALFRGDRARDRGRDTPGRPDPMQILDERLARGEIDAEDYRARRDVLAAEARAARG